MISGSGSMSRHGLISRMSRHTPAIRSGVAAEGSMRNPLIASMAKIALCPTSRNCPRPSARASPILCSWSGGRVGIREGLAQSRSRPVQVEQLLDPGSRRIRQAFFRAQEVRRHQGRAPVPVREVFHVGRPGEGVESQQDEAFVGWIMLASVRRRGPEEGAGQQAEGSRCGQRGKLAAIKDGFHGDGTTRGRSTLVGQRSRPTVTVAVFSKFIPVRWVPHSETEPCRRLLV